MTEMVNRRNSLRMTDRVLLAVVPSSAERLAALTEDFRQGISLYNQEGLTDIQLVVGAQSALVRLREKDPDLAEFLQHLDNKVNLLLRQGKGEKGPLDELAMQKVNLSADGLSFDYAREVRVGDLLEIHMVLLPAYVNIYCFGRVVACSPETEKPEPQSRFRVAVEFVLLMEEDREKIVQHNFKQQNLVLRNRRLLSE